MTDDYKKNKNTDDIDDFFKEFDKINDNYKKGTEKVNSTPNDSAELSNSDDKIVANRSERYSQKKNKSYYDDSTGKESQQINSGEEEPLTDLNDLFDESDAEQSTMDTPVKESVKGGGLSAMAEKIKKNAKKISSRKGSGKSSSRKKRKDKKNRKKVWLKRILAACGILAVAGIIFVAFVLQDTKKIDYNNIYEYLAESSVIYDDEGNAVDSIYSGEGSRVIVDYDDMPKNLVNAFVSIEDKTFWDHNGFNFIRMAGAVKDAIVGGDRVGGTSTITQQLARNLWLTETRSSRGFSGIVRKIKEAYYTIQLERHLSKEQIIEAYLNTIALGQNSLGVQSASQAYFSKDVQDLSLLQCAALASLPQAPGRYAYIKTVGKGEVSKDDPRIIKTGKTNTYLYNDEAEWRVQLVLKFMKEQGYINSSQLNKVNVSKLRKAIKPNLDNQSDKAQFFIDYAIENITKDLMEKYHYTEKDATQMIYSGGLKIYTTMNRKMQNAVEEQFKNTSNFPGVTNLNTDGSGNILREGGGILMYNYGNYFNSNGDFTLSGSEFKLESNGDIVLKKGKRLNFYEVESNGLKDINVEFKDIYQKIDGAFYSMNGGVISIPAKYKKLDSKGNVVIDSSFMKDKPKFMSVSKSKIVVPTASYTLRQQVRQPQASMVILDHSNGQLKAMVGGREIEGKMNYNRSISPRQPGSSIKPIGAYGPAIETGAEGEHISGGESSFGSYWTSASIIKDEEMTFNGKVWPKNWYSGYRGPMTLRKAVEQSVNTTAVKVLNNIGPEKSAAFLKKLGVTSVVESGSTNDMNPAALALGGMTKGISPLEMASAYGTFANKGVHVEPTAYTVIKNREGEKVLESKPKSEQAMDPGTAFIMTDILRTVVSNGIGNAAALSGHSVAGKTGTTTDNYDAWFVGMTGKYAASLWIGNDVNIELSEGSSAAARLWSRTMSNALSGVESTSFAGAPSNVSKRTIDGISDYFIDGTAPGSLEIKEEKVKVCTKSGDLATPWCPHVKEVSYNSLNSDSSSSDDKIPEHYCNLHNLDAKQFPIDPKKKLDKSFKDPKTLEKERREKEKQKQREKEEKEKEQQTDDPVVPEDPTQDPAANTQGMRLQNIVTIDRVTERMNPITASYLVAADEPLNSHLQTLSFFPSKYTLTGTTNYKRAS